MVTRFFSGENILVMSTALRRLYALLHWLYAKIVTEPNERHRRQVEDTDADQ